MKRMHIGLRVDDLAESIAFYSKLFGTPPSLHRNDYAKWMLDDPRINFSIETWGDDDQIVTHLGLQVDDEADLGATRSDWDGAGLARQDQNDIVCGYQRQDKSWVHDPQGLPWEVFQTHEVVDEYGTTEMPEPS